MLKTNWLKQKLNDKHQVLGTWCIIDSPAVADVISSTGVDFLIIDAEHGAISYETASNMIRACESFGVSPIMRVGNNDESLVLRALDIGIHGLQMPNITCVEDAKKFVEFSKYPPVGNRGLSPYTRAGLFDRNNGSLISTKGNENTLLIANVESENGINNIKDIASVEHIDVFFIGLFDLSKSMGIPGDVENPKVIEKLSYAVENVHLCGKKIGSIATNPSMLIKLKNIGVDYITYSVDTGILKESYQNIVNIFKG